MTERHHIAPQDYEGKRQLKLELEAAGVDISAWDGPGQKGLDGLYQELLSGESLITWDDGQIIRVVNGLGLDVFVTLDDRSRYHLQEEKQVFNNGTVRVRNLSTSLGEKILEGEAIEHTAARALREELGVLGVLAVRMGAVETHDWPSSSYPGLPTIVVTQHAQAELNPVDFDPKGYKEIQPNKTTYFTWVNVAD